MTEGHKHREVHVWGWVEKALRKPLRIYAVVPHTPAWDALDKSPYPYGPYEQETWIKGEYERYYLSLLSILHRWTGLTLVVKED